MEYFKNKIKIIDNSYNLLFKIVFPIKKNFEKIYSNLNETQLKVLEYYKENGAFIINKFLYSKLLTLQFNELSSLSDIIKNNYIVNLNNIKLLDEIINLYTSKNKLRVFRGIGNGKHSDIFLNLSKGDTFKFSNFLSCSLNPNVAYNFTVQNELQENIKKNKPKILLVMDIPKGMNFFYLTLINYIKNSNNKNKKKTKKKILDSEKLSQSEFEIILPRNCNFEITSISTIEENFFSLDWNTDWNKYEEFLNTKNNVKKIKVYHLKFLNIENIPLPDLNEIEIDYKFFKNNKILSSIFYIPCNKNYDYY